MTASPPRPLTTPAPGTPTARQLRVRLRRARRAHHVGSLSDVLTDGYVVVFFIAMYGWMTVDALDGYFESPSVGRADPGSRHWLALAAALAVAGIAWQALRAIGPIMVAPATMTWLVSTPVSRRAWLVPRLALLVGAAAGLVAMVGVVVAYLTGQGYGWAALAGAATGGGVVALGVVAQRPPRPRPSRAEPSRAERPRPSAVISDTTRPRPTGAEPSRVGPVPRGGRLGRGGWPAWLGWALTGGGASLAIAVITWGLAGERLGWAAELPVAPRAALPPYAVVALLAAVVVVAVAARTVSRLDRATLTAGAGLANAAVTATLMLDLSLLTDLVAQRRWRAVGRVRSGRLRPGGRWWVLLQAELRRLRRRPAALLAWAALVLVQYAVALALPGLAGTAQLVGAYLATGRLTGGLTAVTRAPGLRRAIGGSDRLLHLTHMLVPALGAVVWWLVTAPASGNPLGWLDAALVLGVVAAAHRYATRPPISYGGAVTDTPFGMVPVDLLRQIARGPTLLAVLIAIRYLLG